MIHIRLQLFSLLSKSGFVLKPATGCKDIFGDPRGGEQIWIYWVIPTVCIDTPHACARADTCLCTNTHLHKTDVNSVMPASSSLSSSSHAHTVTELKQNTYKTISEGWYLSKLDQCALSLSLLPVQDTQSNYKIDFNAIGKTRFLSITISEITSIFRDAKAQPSKPQRCYLVNMMLTSS